MQGFPPHLPGSTVIRSSSFISEGSATASANRLGAVVGAFEEAANHALTDIAARTAQAVQNPQKVDAPVPSITR